MTTWEVEEHSHCDAELSEVRRCIREGDWSNKDSVKYFLVKEELCVIGKWFCVELALSFPKVWDSKY